MTTLTIEAVTLVSEKNNTLTARVTDQFANNINSEKVVFKINGKTVKDENGKVIYANIDSNGEVSVDHNIGNLKAKTYNVTAVFISSEYGKLEDNTTLTVA